MPLLAGSAQQQPTTPEPGGSPASPAPVSEPGEYVPTWIDPDGDVWELNPPGTDFFTLNAVSGYGLTPVTLHTTPNPWGGVTVQGVREEPRVLTWPVRMRRRTHLEFLAVWRAVAESFAKTFTQGPGLFRLTRPDGSAREVLAYYQGGWDGEPGQGWLEDTPKLSLLCPDGMWRDSTPVTLEWTDEEQSDYLSPYPNVSSGQTLGGPVDVLNPGKADAWPEWQLTGPASGLVATSLTLGRQFAVVRALDVGETITITTRPGRVVGPDGQMIAGAIQRPGSSLWPLTRGVNRLQFAVSGSGPGMTLRLRFFPLYHTA